jgi:hypothetical protein
MAGLWGRVMLRPLGCAIAFACVALLVSCTGAPLMGWDISDYRDTFGTTGNEQILANILLAKDNSPLHFSELQTLGSSIQLTSSLQATDPFGELHGSSTRAGVQGTLSAQNTPTFSLGSLETESFTQGLMTAVNPIMIKQFLDEGIDQRLILILFFSSVRYHDNIFLNNTKCDETKPDCYKHFFDYLGVVDAIATNHLIANIYSYLTPIGASMPWPPSSTGLKDLSGIDTTKYSVEVVGANATVYSISPIQLALCYQSTAGGRPTLVSALSGTPSAACSCARVKIGSIGNCSELSYPSISNAFTVRSVYQIIEYLGQILNFQEKEAPKDRCIKLGGDPNHRSCDDTDVLFQVNAKRGAPLVSTLYQGSRYTVAVGSCETDVYCDHSAEVLKIVNLLINVNKSATDIPAVPTVRIIQ